MYYFIFNQYENVVEFDLFDNLNQLQIFVDLNNCIKKQYILLCYIVYISNDMYDYILNIKFIYLINNIIFKIYSNKQFYSILVYYLCEEQKRGYNFILKKLCD